MSDLKYAQFYYGITVDETNSKIDIDEGSGELTAQIPDGSYSLEDLATAVAAALNTVGANTYAASVDRATRVITITVDQATDFLFGTGTNNAANAVPLLGIDGVDALSATVVEGDVGIGQVWAPQFPLQSYVDPDDNQMAAFATVNESASGRVQVQRFGVRRFAEMEAKFINDYPQPAGSVIHEDRNACANARSFFEYAVQKEPFEFMPDATDPDTFYTMLLESTEADKLGVSFKTKEMTDSRLSGYFKTGIFKLRVIE